MKGQKQEESKNREQGVEKRKIGGTAVTVTEEFS